MSNGSVVDKMPAHSGGAEVAARHSEGSAPSVKLRGPTIKRKKRNTTQACDRCQIARRRCGGGNPCPRCRERGTECLYSRLDGRTARRLNGQRGEEGEEGSRCQSNSNSNSNSNTACFEEMIQWETPLEGVVGVVMDQLEENHTVHPDVTNGVAVWSPDSASEQWAVHLDNCLVREQYTALYCDKVDVWLSVSDARSMTAHLDAIKSGASDSATSFLLSTAAALAARGSGDLAAFNRIIGEARAVAGGLFDEYNVGTCMGFVLLSWAFLPTDIRRAESYANVASSIANLLPQSVGTAAIDACRTKSFYISFLAGSSRPLKAKHALLKESWPTNALSATDSNSVAEVPVRARVFRMFCEILELTGPMLTHIRDGMLDAGVLDEAVLGPFEVLHVAAPARVSTDGGEWTDIHGLKRPVLSENKVAQYISELEACLMMLAGWVATGELDPASMYLHSALLHSNICVVYWRGGRPQDGVDAMRIAVTRLSTLEVSFSPPCNLWVLLLLAEYCYECCHLSELEILTSTVARMSWQPRAAHVVPVLQQLCARLEARNLLQEKDSRSAR